MRPGNSLDSATDWVFRVTTPTCGCPPSCAACCSLPHAASVRVNAAKESAAMPRPTR
ncbi:Uncharacterised protein [Bordetella pertussis]|nr:Uncharacterised protein [Bordetella pertussis]